MDFTKFDDGFFAINELHGFLPKIDPLETLPTTYSQLQFVLNNLPKLINSKEGLESAVADLPNYLNHVQELCDHHKRNYQYGNQSNIENILTIQALFRGYAFLSSAYLLQPSYLYSNSKPEAKGIYGPAKTILPSNLAQPFEAVASALGVYPWLDYHYSYDSGNYVKINPAEGYQYSNLKTAVNFSGTRDEIGFITVHIEIISKTPQLIQGIKSYLEGEKLQGLTLVLESIKTINETRKHMWVASNHKNYNAFRPFLMGIKGNESIFGAEGVLYEGSLVSGDRRTYRGQTAAQDDTIPTLDIFTGLVHYYPDNELTTYLLDLRQYRPPVFQAFFTELAKHTISYKSLELGCQKLLYLILGEIYVFRNGHWQFVQKYIMENTSYESASGGTNIISFLPNQIEAVLNCMGDVLIDISRKGKDGLEFYNAHGKKLKAGKCILDKQKAEMCKLDYQLQKVYDLGKEFNEWTETVSNNK